MGSVDLGRPFLELINERHEESPGLRLESDLKKVNAVLVSYARAIGTALKNLSVLHVCADSTRPHPHLIKHIESQYGDKKYAGQHVSRLKKLIRNLPWPGESESDEESKPVILEECLPRHLREIWFLLPRTNGHTQKRMTEEAYRRHRATLHLSPQGLALGFALLKVSNTNNVSDIKTLLEENATLIYLSLREDNARPKIHALKGSFGSFRQRVRDQLGYTVEQRPEVALRLEELQEPLQSQVRMYVERARNGFKSGREILKLAKSKYDLELGCHAEATIEDYVFNLLFGIGYIYRGTSTVVTDIRDLLRLETKEVEVDGVIISEPYNPLVEYYRNSGLDLVSERKEEGCDTEGFRFFIRGLTAVAAYNGFLRLRKLFVREYKAATDRRSRAEHKEKKKEAFTRPWLDGQIQRLKVEFHNIANEGSFKNKPSGALGREARRNLNLCLFYVALLSLRFLGVRQGSLRDCKLGENIIVVSHKRMTFQWPKTKNDKGIRHRLDIKKHSATHAELIDAVWTYYKKIYPYISGISASDQTFTLLEARRRKVAGEFFLRCGNDGLCIPFYTEENFYAWFTNKADLYLDMEGVPPGMHFNPHFLRAMFGDWLRFDLRFSKDEAAEIAADSEQVFEEAYITYPRIFDATDSWTRKNQEISASRDDLKGADHDSLLNEVVQLYEGKMAEMRQTISTMAETINKLTDRAS